MTPEKKKSIEQQQKILYIKSRFEDEAFQNLVGAWSPVDITRKRFAELFSLEELKKIFGSGEFISNRGYEGKQDTTLIYRLAPITVFTRLSGQRSTFLARFDDLIEYPVRDGVRSLQEKGIETYRSSANYKDVRQKLGANIQVRGLSEENVQILGELRRRNPLLVFDRMKSQDQTGKQAYVIGYKIDMQSNIGEVRSFFDRIIRQLLVQDKEKSFSYLLYKIGV